jgi:hypothetical protein
MNEAYCKSLLKDIQSNLQNFEALLSQLPVKAEKDSNNKSGEVKDLLFTLTAVEEDVFEMRLKKIIDQENPYIPAIYPEKVKNSYTQEDSSLSALVQKYLKQKESIVKYLNHVPFFYWDRTGVHELDGHVTFEELIRRFIRNDKGTIESLKKK